MEVITSSSLTSTLILCPSPTPSLCPATPLGGGVPWEAQTQVHVRPRSSSNLLMHKAFAHSQAFAQVSPS